MSQRRLNASMESPEGALVTKGGWMGPTRSPRTHISFHVSFNFLFNISALLIFLTSVSSLFHLTNCGHNRFCWLALFLLLQKHVFMNKTPDGRKTIPAITVHCNFDTFCSQMFLSGGGDNKRERSSSEIP